MNICQQLKKSSWHAFLQEPETSLLFSPLLSLHSSSQSDQMQQIPEKGQISCFQWITSQTDPNPWEIDTNKSH